MDYLFIWPFSWEHSSCVCITVVRHTTEQYVFLLRILLDKRYLMTNLFIKFVNSIWIHCYPANHMFQRCTESGMKSGPLMIETVFNWNVLTSEVLWDVQTRLESSLWKPLHWLSQETGFSKVSIPSATDILKFHP